ncbi:MAG: PEP-CTERM sorting domain-containing protein [Deltaproteobacteria bacterium]|nr:PEP-CTERM sorting domain-containing protein [Deltaproteobacteria bacterium]
MKKTLLSFFTLCAALGVSAAAHAHDGYVCNTDQVSVPEPATLLMLGGALGGTLLLRKLKARG